MLKGFARLDFSGRSWNVKRASEFFLLTSLVALLLSPYMFYRTIAFPFLNGPKIWLYLVVGATGIVLSTSLALNRLFHSAHVFIVTKTDIILLTLILLILSRDYLLHHTSFPPEKVVTYSSLVILYYIIRNWSKPFFQEDFISYFFLSFIILIILLAGYGILQFFGLKASHNSYFAVTGPFANPARYGNFLIAIFPFVFTSLFYFPRDFRLYKINRGLSLIGVPLGIIAIILTNTRSAWVGGLLSAMVIIPYGRKAVKLFLRYKIYILISVSVLVLKSAFLLYNLRPASVLGRITIWKISAGMLRVHPLLGSGYGTFEGKYADYQAEYFSHERLEGEILRADVVRYPYNVFLQIGIEQGVIGLTIFIFLCVVIFQHAKAVLDFGSSRHRIFAMASLSSFLAILACGQFSYPFDIIPVLIVFFINIAIIENVRQDMRQKQVEKAPVKTGSVYVLTLFCGLIMCSSIYLIHRGLKKKLAYTFWELYSYEGFKQMDLLYPELSDDIEFIQQYSEMLMRQKRYLETVHLLQRSKDLVADPQFYLRLAQSYYELHEFTKAQLMFEHACYMIPNRIYSKYLLVRFYYETNQFNKATALAKKILNMPVKIHSAFGYMIRQDLRKLISEKKHLRRKFISEGIIN